MKLTGEIVAFYYQEVQESLWHIRYTMWCVIGTYCDSSETFENLSI